MENDYDQKGTKKKSCSQSEPPTAGERLYSGGEFLRYARVTTSRSGVWMYRVDPKSNFLVSMSSTVRETKKNLRYASYRAASVEFVTGM